MEGLRRFETEAEGPVQRPGPHGTALSVFSGDGQTEHVDCEVSGKKAELILRLSDPEVQAQARARRPRPPPFVVRGLGLESGGKTAKGSMQLTLETLEHVIVSLEEQDELAEGGPSALRSLLEWRRNEARLGFLRPLLKSCRKGSAGWRVHPQLNLNTVTGRLSSRNPNVQGEPVKHSVRSVVAAQAGRRLLVADYAQLELRLVAHLTDCKSMISLLSQGGDIHSRTAYRMFEEVRQAVDAGEVALDELDDGEGSEGVPLVKEVFSELRRRSKTLNFSLLYGKTAWPSAL